MTGTNFCKLTAQRGTVTKVYRSPTPVPASCSLLAP